MGISSLANVASTTERTMPQNQIGFELLSKNLDSMKAAGDGIKKMMEEAVMPHLGQNIDVYV